jgi:hypothetical protein
MIFGMESRLDVDGEPMAERVRTPVGELCIHCGEPIAEDDKGFVSPLVSLVEGKTIAEAAPYHRACFLRGFVGSVGHQNRTCSCYGGVEEDPPGMTKRQAAEAAVALYDACEGSQ